MLRDVGRFRTWVGATLLLSATGQAFLIQDFASALSGEVAEVAAENVPWCPMAEHSTRAFRSISGEFCYATYTVQLAWEDAVEFCSEKGGRLARLDGRGMIDVQSYNSMFHYMKDECALVGLSKQNGHWQWLDGSPMTERFDPDLINRLFTCAAIRRQGASSDFFRVLQRFQYVLTRQYCGRTGEFVCEYDLPEQVKAGRNKIGSGEIYPADLKIPEDTGLVSERDTVNDTVLVSEPAPMDGSAPMDRTAPIGGTAPIDDTTPMDGTAPIDDTTPMDDPHPIHDTAPIDNTVSKDGTTPEGDNERSDSRITIAKPKPKLRQRRTQKTSEDTYLDGKHVFRKSLKSVSSCVWKCFKFGTSCTVINYNANIPECVGFASIGNVIKEKRDNWQVWEKM